MSSVINPNQRGPKGDPGTNGTNGTNGAPGTAATIAVGTVSTGAPGSSATVTNAGTSSAAVFNFAIPRGDVGATGAAGLGTVTPSTPARTLNSNFQPNATKAVNCLYSVNCSVTNPLLAGSSIATVQLLSDASNPPTTIRAEGSASSAVGLAVTIALTTTNTVQLSYICPPGHFVRLATTTSGTAAATLVRQTEETLG